jgi:hypothetical protein
LFAPVIEPQTPPVTCIAITVRERKEREGCWFFSGKVWVHGGIGLCQGWGRGGVRWGRDWLVRGRVPGGGGGCLGGFVPRHRAEGSIRGRNCAGGGWGEGAGI